MLLPSVLALSGTADFKLRMGELRLDPQQQAIALQAVDVALRQGITADDLARAPVAIIGLGLMAAYREAFGVGVASALVLAAAVCLAVALIAWLWLRPMTTLAGLLLQIDDPWLTQILQADGGPTEQDRRRAADRHIEYMNHVLRDIPADRVRFHACYGINHGPRVLEVPMRLVAEYLVKLDVGAYSFEAANPRHQHEWRVWEDVDLPEDRVLLPGLLNHATNYVEHPELIAEYLVRYADLVGRERVIASADCGFSSQAYVHTEVHPTVVWAKLEALAQGAELATKRLWP